MTRLFAGFIANVIALTTRLVTAVQARWIGCGPEPVRRVYFANHASHGDFVLIWTLLPDGLREATRPVAGADYWLKGRLRRFIGRHVFNAVFVDRTRTNKDGNPIETMSAALNEGASLIIFPEGTRNTTAERLLPFKSGLFHLARQNREVEFVPVWIANLNRVLPKGEVLPIPLLCSVSFGPPLKLGEDEDKAEFLERAREALLGLAPKAL